MMSNNRHLLFSCFIASFFLFLSSQLNATAIETLDDLQWHAPDSDLFDIRGLPFHEENQGQWIRFPLRAQEVVPKAVWNNAVCPSGGRIRFKSDSSFIGLRVTYRSLPGMRNMHSFGQAGVDAYIDGQYLATLAPRSATEVEGFLLKNGEKKMRNVTLYLPLYMGLDVREIGLEPGATIEPPENYQLQDPVVFYGTSITMGGCASRPGMSYQAMLERELNIDFVNFGFSGAGKGEKEVCEFVREVSAALYVIGMAQNNPTAEDLEKHFGPFLSTLRETRPETPILCITPIYMTTEFPGVPNEKVLQVMREVIRKEVRRRIDAGDKNLYLVEGYSLLGPGQGDGFVDGVHPNDLGFYWMAEGIEPHIRAILEIN